MGRLRDALNALLGEHKAEAAEVAKEVAELEADRFIEHLIGSGKLPADDATRTAAAQLHQANPDAFRAIMTAPTPLPAQPAQVLTPTQPVDKTEAAIQGYMSTNNVPYHVAAIEVSRGATIVQPTANPQTT